jgi:hypothetical protein
MILRNKKNNPNPNPNPNPKMQQQQKQMKLKLVLDQLIEIQDLKRTRPMEEIGNDFVMDMPTMDLLKLMQYHYDHKVSPRKVFIPLLYGKPKYKRESNLVQCADCSRAFSMKDKTHYCHICFPCLICSKPYSNRQEFQYVYHPCHVDFYDATIPEYSKYCKLAAKWEIYSRCTLYHWKLCESKISFRTLFLFYYEIWRLWQQKDQSFIYWIPEEIIQQILNDFFT